MMGLIEDPNNEEYRCLLIALSQALRRAYLKLRALQLRWDDPCASAQAREKIAKQAERAGRCLRLRVSRPLLATAQEVTLALANADSALHQGLYEKMIKNPLNNY